MDIFLKDPVSVVNIRRGRPFRMSREGGVSVVKALLFISENPWFVKPGG